VKEQKANDERYAKLVAEEQKAHAQALTEKKRVSRMVRAHLHMPLALLCYGLKSSVDAHLMCDVVLVLGCRPLTKPCSIRS
jgi:hypothetical protein